VNTQLTCLCPSPNLVADDQAAIVHDLHDNAWSLMGTDVLPIVHSTFPLAEAERAHELMQSGELVAKAVLEVA